MRYPPLNPKQWELVSFTKHPTHDSIWSMTRGADGHIYVGLCEEFTGGGVAQLYRYNVERHKLEHCADLSRVCGEPADSGHATQGKIHFALCAASDGTIYGATHCTTPPMHHRVWSAYGMWDDPLFCFPGGHIFRYDPATGRTTDFGVIFPHEGIPFMVLDEARERLYGITFPKAHFFRVNLAGRDRVDYGRVSSWYPIGLSFDAEMNVFFSDTNSQLIKYDVRADRVLFLRQTPYSQPWNASKRFSWISNMGLADDGLMYCTHYCNDHLLRFDPKAATPKFEDLGPGAPERPSRLLRTLIPDGRGRVYYSAGPRVGLDDRAALFVRYDIATGRKEVLGEMRVGDRALSSWIGVLDLKGNIYIKGSGRPMTLAIFHPED